MNCQTCPNGQNAASCGSCESCCSHAHGRALPEGWREGESGPECAGDTTDTIVAIVVAMRARRGEAVRISVTIEAGR